MGMRRYGQVRGGQGRHRRRLLPLRSHRERDPLHDRSLPLVDTSLLTDIQRFGAADVSACFSCGNCTATCPLVGDDSTFPRRMIRYAQVGMRDQLLSSKELWTCYACGECSETCPTQAEPSEFMAAARRYAIASYDRTGFARTMYTRPVVGTLIAVAAGRVLRRCSCTRRTAPKSAHVARHLRLHPRGADPRHGHRGHGRRLRRRPARRGDDGAARSPRQRRDAALGGRRPGGACEARRGAAWSALAVETLGQRRYRDGLRAPDDAAQPWYLRRWFLHAATMWGFLGLLAATILDYGLAVVGHQGDRHARPDLVPGPPARHGRRHRAGLRRDDAHRAALPARRSDRVRHSTAADWTFLVLLFVVTGVTGFALELALYLPEPPAWGYWVFLFHVAVAMELVLLAPFMKLAHAIYRPLALFFMSFVAKEELS